MQYVPTGNWAQRCIKIFRAGHPLPRGVHRHLLCARVTETGDSEAGGYVGCTPHGEEAPPPKPKPVTIVKPTGKKK